MATYTLHLDRDAHPGGVEALDRAVLVKDGFSWGAFLFTFLWFWTRGLWLTGLLVALAMVALAVGARLAGAGLGTIWLALLVLSLLIGLEASSLRRWTLSRRGRPAVDVVSAGSREEAETRAFARWLERTGMPDLDPGPVAGSWQRPAPVPHTPPSSGPAVIGLFPEAETRR